MTTIVILTALEQKERQIVLSYLKNHKIFKHPETGTDYYECIKSINGVDCKIVLGRTDQTNVNAGIETERVISYYKPAYIFFLGVAGGLKDVEIGDIVIGQDVYGYERGKVDEEEVKGKKVPIYKPRPKFGASSYMLERAATNYSCSAEWLSVSDLITDKKFSPKISIYTGTIAAGEKVVASISSDLYKFLKINCSHALAVEMEGLGFLEACRAYPAIKTLLLRGISDKVDNKSTEDEKGSQEYATNNAARFLFGLLEKLEITADTHLPKPFYLLDILCKLYPEGLKDNRIWQRAGGDLAKLQLSNNGMTQWYDALDLIAKGGGGNADLESLLNVMKSDFPKELQDLN